MSATINRSHQSALFDPAHARPVHVIGVGSVGSHVVYQLASVGVSDITVWDDDNVESHNIPMSLYDDEDLAVYKVEALARHIRRRAHIELKTKRKKYEGEPLRGSIVASVDTMTKGRMVIWKQVKHNPLVDILVDTRIAGEYLEVYSVNPTDPEDIAWYESYLYPDEETLNPTCGSHGIITVTSVAAGVAVARLTNAWNGRKRERLFRLHMGSLQVV